MLKAIRVQALRKRRVASGAPTLQMPGWLATRQEYGVAARRDRVRTQKLQRPHPLLLDDEQPQTLGAGLNPPDSQGETRNLVRRAAFWQRLWSVGIRKSITMSQPITDTPSGELERSEEDARVIAGL